jgi:hypothetical protein
MFPSWAHETVGVMLIGWVPSSAELVGVSVSSSLTGPELKSVEVQAQLYVPEKPEE